MKMVDFTVATAINQEEYSGSVTRANFIVVLSSVFIGIIGLLIIFFFSNSIAGGIKMIAEGARRFSRGDFVLEGMDFNKINKINERNDEMGDIGKAFNELIGYLQQKTALAEKIAGQNLDVEVPISSEQDNLGKALKLMVGSLNSLISQILAAAEQVSAGSRPGGELLPVALAGRERAGELHRGDHRLHHRDQQPVEAERRPRDRGVQPSRHCRKTTLKRATAA